MRKTNLLPKVAPNRIGNFLDSEMHEFRFTLWELSPFCTGLATVPVAHVGLTSTLANTGYGYISSEALHSCRSWVTTKQNSPRYSGRDRVSSGEGEQRIERWGFLFCFPCFAVFTVTITIVILFLICIRSSLFDETMSNNDTETHIIRNKNKTLSGFAFVFNIKRKTFTNGKHICSFMSSLRIS